jgi:hypothetical protein
MNNQDKIKELEAKQEVIVKELEALKNQPEFKAGDWVHSEGKGIHVVGMTCIYRIHHLLNDGTPDPQVGICKTSGDNGDGSQEINIIEKTEKENFYYSNVLGNNVFIHRLATDKEIAGTLLFIAEHKGFKLGAKYRPIDEWGVEYDVTHTVGTFIYKGGVLHCQSHPGFIYACGRWAQIVKEEKFKSGDWVYINGIGDYTHCHYIFKLKAFNTGNQFSDAEITFEKNKSGTEKITEEFNDYIHLNRYPNARLATQEEITYVLIRLAIQKGFTRGTRYLPRAIKTKELIKYPEDTLIFTSCLVTTLDVILIHGDFAVVNMNVGTTQDYIYVHGKWAEIKKDFEIVPGYPVKFLSSDFCEINNKQYQKEQIQLLRLYLGVFKDTISSINVGCSGQFKLSTTEIDMLTTTWEQVCPSDFTESSINKGDKVRFKGSGADSPIYIVDEMKHIVTKGGKCLLLRGINEYINEANLIKIKPPCKPADLLKR